MAQTQYYAPGELYFSAIFGGGIYRRTGEMVPDPLAGGGDAQPTAPLLVSLRTGETFFPKLLGPNSARRCREQILSPAPRAHILWPSDLLHLDPAQRADCGLTVAGSRPAPESQPADALLFPWGDYPAMVPARRMLDRLEAVNWRSPQVRRMAVEIVRGLEELNRGGYCYGDIHPSRIRFLDSGGVFFDYSNLVFSLRAPAVDLPQVEDCPVEFAEPALIQGRIPRADLHTQNYSLCALLFYLFLGRYPYDGRLLTGYLDDTPQQHYVKFRDYHKMPVFIFDPDDTQNSLGAFWEERQVIALWEELPQSLRELFIPTLGRENALRTAPVNNPTPSAWLRAFRELGWCGEEEGETHAERV